MPPASSRRSINSDSAPSGCGRRIFLLTTLPGVDFASCYASRIEVAVDGLRVNFIDLENLKKNKQASGRHQDLADLENLQ
jgi:hypothetical protein